MGSGRWSFAGGVIALGLAPGCGRLGFDPGTSGDGGAGGTIDAITAIDAIALDDTSCDELAGLRLCEPFDTGSSLPTVTADAPSTLTFDTARPYRGAASLHSHTEANGTPAWRLGQALGTIDAGDLYARWYLFVSPSITQPFASTHLLEDNLPFHGVVFGMTADGKPDLSYTGTGTGTGPDPLPRDRWVCVQVHIVVDPTSGLVESWIDGVPAARLDALPTLPGNGYNNVHAGHFSGGPTHTEVADLWTDELAVGTLPIPCD